ncbi:PREDICTED: uncharacterized protein LOC104793078 isoform X1 [Camelina sativa]|uniref:Uncharacterized protein LOC104793078 isoform X1 n=1 Tax=Camelina sativa TaxID=90675 RepID=A0ABM1Q6D1_CAMSA|nr:PREDICTED: uncharacterized protein LOC104793078 isoform X1 [Camelina sativa]
MGRERVKMKMKMKLKLKLKRKPKELRKKARVLCDFCGVSTTRRYEQSPHKQEHEALSMESELKRLRLLTRRMTGKDLDGSSFEELLLLRNHLDRVMDIVTNQKDKIKLEKAERLRQQKKEAGDENEGWRRRVLVPCSTWGKKVDMESVVLLLNPILPLEITYGIRSGERQEKQADKAPPPPLSRSQIEYERRKAESMHSKFERLWLLKERMNGRELTGMTIIEHYLLLDQLYQGFRGLNEHL